MWSLKILHRGKRLQVETKTAQSVQHKYSMFNSVQYNHVQHKQTKNTAKSQHLQQNQNVQHRDNMYSINTTHTTQAQ